MAGCGVARRVGVCVGALVAVAVMSVATEAVASSGGDPMRIPAGGRIVMAVSRGGASWLVTRRLDETHWHELTSVPAPGVRRHDLAPVSISPDGSRVAFMRVGTERGG